MRWMPKWPNFGIGKYLTNGYLLDSHVFLWCISNQRQLGAQTRWRLRQAAFGFFSSISVAELAIKASRGHQVLPTEIEQRAKDFNLSEIEYASLDAHEIPRFPSLIGHDPFDRLILAQAAARGLKLITADRKLLDLGFDWILDARL